MMLPLPLSLSLVSSMMMTQKRVTINRTFHTSGHNDPKQRQTPQQYLVKIYVIVVISDCHEQYCQNKKGWGKAPSEKTNEAMM